MIVLDQRGFGQSTQFDDPANYGLQMADDVIRLLDHLQIRRAHLVGHSMGGVVATNVASRYPDRVLSATVIAPPEYADAEAWERANLRWATELDRGAGLTSFLRWLFPAWTPEVAAQRSAEALAVYRPASLAAVIRATAALMVPASEARAARVPMVIAVASDDPLAPQGRELAARWPGARLVEVPGADHATIVTRPEVHAEMRALIRANAQPTAGSDTPAAAQQQPATPTSRDFASIAPRLRALDVIPDTRGTGPYPASKEQVTIREGLDVVVYRPTELSALGGRKLGVHVWGNGGCSGNGAGSRFHLLDIVSYG